MLHNSYLDIRYILIVNYKEIKTFLIIKIIIIFIVKNYDLFNYLLELIIISFKFVINVK